MVSRGQQPAQGRATWAFARDPLELECALTAPTGGAGPQASTWADFVGRLSLDVQRGAWTILQVRDVQNPTLVRTLRIAPFEGHRSEAVDLGSGRTALRIQAWAKGLARPLAGATLRVRWEALGVSKEARTIELLTDASGFAEADDLPPGAILVMAPSARETDPWPACVRVVATPYDVPRELACVVVQPEERRVVRLSTLADDGLGERTLKLFLRRLDGAGELYPQSGVVRSGASEDEVVAPDGQYGVGVLPLGAAIVEPSTVRIEGEQDLRLRLRKPPEERTLSLLGIPDRSFPLRIVPQADGELAGLDPLLLFLGPMSWTRREAEVGVVPLGSRLVALARQATFISDGILAGDTTEVAMRPASMLYVEWLDGTLSVVEPVVLTVASRDALGVRAMRPILTRSDGVFRPALAARLVIQKGPATLVASTAGGRELWRRDLEATAAQQTVRVEERVR